MEIENIKGGLSNRSESQTEKLNRMIVQINKAPLMRRKHARLSMDTSIGRVIIKIIDTETDTVIREVPPATLQRMYRNIRQHLDNFDLLANNIDV